MKMKNFVCILLFFLSSMAIQAQTTFEAKVSKKKLGINERLRIDFEMNQDGDNFSPPNFGGFEVVGGPNQAISNSWINGKRSYSKTYSYFLQPQRQGTITIDQATIEINGETYKTIPIAVEVTAAVARPNANGVEGTNSDIVAADNVHLVAEVSNSNPFLNEAITVTYKMYVSPDVSITSNWRETQTPKYGDFWNQMIYPQGNFKPYNGKYKGEDYRYVILRTAVLYPQKIGKLEIEPLTLDVPIDIPGNRRDIFGRRQMIRVNQTISAGKRTINVKPLPIDGKPDDFNGAVGSFTFNVKTDKNRLDANESMELNININGSGNLKLFDLPSVKLPSALEVYEPERTENVNTTANGMQGSVTEKYTIVPQFKGNYPIRPITFSYFDPRTETYKTISSEEIIIDVENGPVSSGAVVTSEDGTVQKKELSAEQFKYIALEADLKTIETEDFFKSTIYFVLLGGPFLLIPLFIIAGRKRKARLADVEGNKLRKRNRLAKKYLSEAKRNMKDQVVFYDSLERALHNYLKATLTIETTEMDKERIAQLLREREVNQTTVNEFMNILKSCEFARYTPTSNVTIQQDYEKAVSVISEIDKQIK